MAAQGEIRIPVDEFREGSKGTNLRSVQISCSKNHTERSGKDDVGGDRKP